MKSGSKVCPLCDCTLGKYAVSFCTKIEMCPNEKCLYPFDRKDMLKSNVFDDRSLNSDGTPRKRRRTVPLSEATAKLVPSSTSSSTPKPKARKDGSPQPSLKLSEEPVTTEKNESQSTSALPLAPASTLVTSSAPTASAESLLELLFSDAPTAPETTTASASTTSSPLSKDDPLPDLTFDFLPSVSWTTPVTPPNQRSSPLKKGADVSTSNLENLLFNEFEVDFGNMENFNHLEFDADLEAILQQHL